MTTAATPPRPPSRWRFFLAATLTPMVLAALIGWTGIEHARSLEAQAEAARSFERERALLMLLSAVKDAETAQRGLLLTGDSAFLAPYAPARAMVGRLLQEAGAAGRTLRPLIDAKFAELDGTIALFDTGAGAAMRREVASGRGKRIMDQLRDAVAYASAGERARTAERSASFMKHRDESYRLLETTGALVSLILLGVMLALWRSQCDRYDAARAAHEAAARSAAILASTTDTLLIVDPRGTIETINAAGQALLGYATAELQDRDLATILPPRPGDDDLRTWIAADQGGHDIFPGQAARRRDGSEVTVDVGIGVMPGADGDRLVLSLRDASDRLRIARAKDELISTVSHELRTPLTSVVGSLALLRAGFAGEWSPQAARLVDIADNNARRLIRLVNDILDIDRIDSGELAMARDAIDLRAITAQAALDSEGLARRHGVGLVDVVAAAPVMALGDAGRLLQVVTNLLSNAIHASPNGAAVALRAEAVGARARISVEDRGAGIPGSVRPRLFDRFQTQRASGGTGLGLAIAREIVRRLDGTIWFEDREGGGTRFAFDLPLLGAGTDGMAVAAVPVILHVDDDPDLCETVAAALDGTATVMRAAGVGAARALLRERQPRLALLDMQVVDGHGPELIPELVDADGAPIPVVILSGTPAPPVIAARAAAILVKGRDDVATVVETVRRLLRDAEAGR